MRRSDDQYILPSSRTEKRDTRKAAMQRLHNCVRYDVFLITIASPQPLDGYLAVHASRWTWKPAKDWFTGMSSMLLILMCFG